MRLHHFGISKVVLTDTCKSFCLFTFSAFSFSSFSSFFSLLLGLGGSLCCILLFILLGGFLLRWLLWIIFLFRLPIIFSGYFLEFSLFALIDRRRLDVASYQRLQHWGRPKLNVP
jgi:hypothetical protein